MTYEEFLKDALPDDRVIKNVYTYILEALFPSNINWSKPIDLQTVNKAKEKYKDLVDTGEIYSLIADALPFRTNEILNFYVEHPQALSYANDCLENFFSDKQSNVVPTIEDVLVVGINDFISENLQWLDSIIDEMTKVATREELER